MALGKDFKALGEMVVIKFVKVKQKPKMTKTGIHLDMIEQEDVFDMVIHSIGPKAEDYGFKVGDSVIVNDHDLKPYALDDEDDPSGDKIRYGVTRATSVWVVLE